MGSGQGCNPRVKSGAYRRDRQGGLQVNKRGSQVQNPFLAFVYPGSKLSGGFWADNLKIEPNLGQNRGQTAENRLKPGPKTLTRPQSAPNNFFEGTYPPPYDPYMSEKPF